MASRKKGRRVEREIRRKGKGTEINVVSLIDIFAILVFYLLVNALVVQVIPEYQNLKLPLSASKESAHKAITVAVSATDVMVDEHAIMSTSDALSETQELLPALSDALKLAVSAAATGKNADAAMMEVNVVGDRATSYQLLKKVLATCAAAGFERISLAVRERGEA